MNMSQTTRKASNYAPLKLPQNHQFGTLDFVFHSDSFELSTACEDLVRFGFRDRELNFDMRCNENAECVGHCVPFQWWKKTWKANNTQHTFPFTFYPTKNVRTNYNKLEKPCSNLGYLFFTTFHSYTYQNNNTNGNKSTHLLFSTSIKYIP